MTDDEDDDADESFPEANYMQEHYNNYMAERERLQEFPGRVPQRRKRKATDSESNPQQYGEKRDEEEKEKNKPKVRKEGKSFIVDIFHASVMCKGRFYLFL